MAENPDKIELTKEQRELLAKRAKETGRSAAELLAELFSRVARPRREPREGRSLYDAMKEYGLIGAMEGPGDLSTNPDHMKGFGESRAPADTD
ncbi:MAG: hypothetical protein RH917_10615 [Lacipirellulaceae bacterium]